MNRRILILIILMFFILSTRSHSQISREWLSSYHFANDVGKALVTDNLGNVYVTGGSGTDYATLKYNSSGAQQWVSKYNGPGNSGDLAVAIAVDAAGNVYVTGGSTGISSNNDYATIKYNSSGVQQWAARYNGAMNGLDEARSIAVDASGNVYVTGYSLVSGTSWDYVTIKYNSSGTFQWMKNYNGAGNNSDFGYRLVLDAAANVYVTGWSTGSGTSDYDYATIKYSTSGTELWVRTYNGPGDGFDEAKSIETDLAGNVYVTGRSLGGSTNYDYATIKYNSAGDTLWVKRFDGTGNSADIGASVTIDASGNVYVFGQSIGVGTDYDFATIKYNSIGDSLWVRRYNGPGNSVENAYSMALDDSGNVYVTGSSAFSGQNYNYATVKYNSSGDQKWDQIYNGTAGGSDIPYSIDTDASGNVFITGESAGLGQSLNYVTIKYSQRPYADVTEFIQGFYNPSANTMISDTIKLYLRNFNAPYTIADSSKAYSDSSGSAKFYFPQIANGVNYYLVTKHRNSIETWSGLAGSFTAGVLSYNFSTASSQAYGSNQLQIDASPLRFGIYSGDQNQDGAVDVSDVVNVYNDANNFVTGYISTDMTGDNFTDVSDLVITFNNSANFVAIVRP
ncbi:MAG: SBBP repeat-containing protein [bacterium]|nr:SBBP repeat-containing protein [bacterium]